MTLPQQVAAVIEKVNSASMHLLAAQHGQALASLYAVTKISEAHELLMQMHRAGVVDGHQVLEALATANAILKKRVTNTSTFHEVEVSLRQLLPALCSAHSALKRAERVTAGEGEDVEDVSSFLEELPVPVGPAAAAEAVV